MRFLKKLARRLLAAAPGQAFRRWAGPPAMRYAVRHPSRLTLTWMCFVNQFLTSGRQVQAITEAVRRHGPCHLLIFGFGNDSPFYQAINASGRTVFLEDHLEWFRNVTAKYPHLEAYQVRYKTRLADWRAYLENPKSFATELPETVTQTAWNVIFVDAPAGLEENHPGRMDSIRLGSALIKPPGDVFVHDCEREVEKIFSTQFLGAENLKEEIGNLRHYVISVTPRS